MGEGKRKTQRQPRRKRSRRDYYHQIKSDNLLLTTALQTFHCTPWSWWDKLRSRSLGSYLNFNIERPLCP